MGSFEKLGILVIVVIIVMILAVAIYQWGGTEDPIPAGAGFGSRTQSGTEMRIQGSAEKQVRAKYYIPDTDTDTDEAGGAGLAVATRNTWAGDIPKFHRVRPGDVVWKLVVKHWRLKESFSDAITRDNPDLDMKRLRPGQVIRIPNPKAYRIAPAKRKSPAVDRRNLRRYEVQEGDSLGSIAQQHLGRASRYGEIVELNPGLKPRNLKPGQKIFLPRK